MQAARQREREGKGDRDSQSVSSVSLLYSMIQYGSHHHFKGRQLPMCIESRMIMVNPNILATSQ